MRGKAENVNTTHILKKQCLCFEGLLVINTFNNLHKLCVLYLLVKDLFCHLRANVCMFRGTLAGSSVLANVNVAWKMTLFGFKEE